MEHVSSVRPTGKFSEKVENLKRWSRFPGWNFRTESRVPFTFLVVCTSSRSTVGHRHVPGVYDQMEQLFTNRKFHFCYHRNFRGFFVNGKRPRFPRQENLGPYLKLLEILKLENLVKLKIATFISQIRDKGHLFSELLLSVSNIHSHSTRYVTQDNYCRIHARTNYGKFSFEFFASKLW